MIIIFVKDVNQILRTDAMINDFDLSHVRCNMVLSAACTDGLKLFHHRPACRMTDAMFFANSVNY